MISKIKKSLVKVGNRLIPNALKNESGQLSSMVWLIGTAVVVVLIVVVFMKLAPDTAENIWDTFVYYMQDKFRF